MGFHILVRWCLYTESGLSTHVARRPKNAMREYHFISLRQDGKSPRRDKKLSRRGDLISCHGDLSSRHGEIVSHRGELISHRGELIILPRRLRISRRRDTISPRWDEIIFLWHFWAPVLLFYISPIKYVALRVFHDMISNSFKYAHTQCNTSMQEQTLQIIMLRRTPTPYASQRTRTHGYMSLWYNHASILWCACWDYK